MVFDRRLIKNFDMWIVILCLILGATGIAAIYSATHLNTFYSDLFLKQILWFGAGLAVMLLITLFNYRILKELSYIIYGLSLILLLGVLFFGKSALGAQRWLRIGPFSFQPSEFAKLAFIIVLAGYLTPEGMAKRILHLRDLFVPLLLLIPPFILVMEQPDMGTALVFIVILFGMLYFAGFKIWQLLILIGIGAAILPAAWLFLRDYQRMRILVFLNPKMEPLGAGYALTQSRITIGSGKLFGKGFLHGTQTQLRFLPKQHTDFIFSVLGEEFGFLGAIVLLFLFLLLIYRSMKAASTRDMFGRLLVAGIISGFAFQIFVNIGMSIGLVPATGLPLPFISYGGSSLLFTFTGIGIILNVRMRRFMF